MFATCSRQRKTDDRNVLTLGCHCYALKEPAVLLLQRLHATYINAARKKLAEVSLVAV